MVYSENKSFGWLELVFGKCDLWGFFSLFMWLFIIEDCEI